MKYLYLTIPYLIPLICILFDWKPWFLPQNKIHLSFVIGFFFLFHSLFVFFVINSHPILERIQNRNTKYFWILVLGYFAFVILFPIRNMNWGDGLVLLETNLFETKLFGFQFTLDEIGETVFHSFFLRILGGLGFGDDPRYSYRLFSNLSGIAIAFILLKNLKGKTISGSIGIFLFFGSGGFLLFFGYAENYALVTLIHFTLFYICKDWIEKGKDKKKLLYISTAIVSLGILFHLVSGYLVVFLCYLWYEFSPKEEKIRTFIRCALLGTIILLPFFLYFTFLHTPGVDTRSTHLLNLPFYPIKRMISLNHIKEILSVFYFSVSPGLFFILYIYFFYREDWNHAIEKKENIALLYGAVSFLVNGFLQNPQLGFPADWDLMGFYWLPTTMFAYSLWKDSKLARIEFIPTLFFFVSMLLLTAIQLNKEEPKKEQIYQITETLIQDYVAEEKEKIESLDKNDQKFYAKADFLFFKGERLIKLLCPFEGQEQIGSKMFEHRQEWNHYFPTLKNDKEKLKRFLEDATKTNISYIKALEEYTICHPML
ncbi:MAG: dolichyl-phosphate-mannose--protein mannosyltransferase [Leptospira sp.]|nr:dolichyl-phosphate-mannose--protein mannosyltransferase [Leptospira sp.]